MKSTVAIGIFAIATGIPGCATSEWRHGSAPMASGVEGYSTGTRLPRKDASASEQPIRTIGREEWKLDVTRGFGNAVRGN